MSTTKIPCFVIMPFSQTSTEHTEAYWTGHFEQFLKPLIDSYGLDAYRSAPLRGDILRKIITDLVRAPIVVADLTDHNPNVFWELGVRQSFKNGTITIAQEGTKLPFDISNKGTLFYYPQDHVKMPKFQANLKQAILDALSSDPSPDSHVLESISGRGTLFQIIRRDDTIRRLKGLLSELAFNSMILEDVLNTTKQNIAIRKETKPSGIVYSTSRLRHGAIDLLINERYIEAADDFWMLSDSVVGDFLNINDQLSLWESTPNATEKYLVYIIPKIQARTKKFQDTVQNSLSQLKSLIQ
ncbi:MAG: hypothetical protein JRN20_01355 [Nitrososphaerota archaeon]|nr:hypothetical protein [Nitrososphaerota archaeon]